MLSILKNKRLDYLMLLPVLGLAFYIAFIPHQDYAYPMHVDEWVHLARSQAIQQAADTTFINPFNGQSAESLGSNLETSFQLFWAVFQQISGISWPAIFRYFPGIIFIITVLSVYVLAQREGFGLEAAFLTCLIPTTVGILGPAFLVPVSMGLLFTPLILFLAFNYRTIGSYILIFILLCFLLAIHAPSAICPIIVLIPYILLNLKGNFKHSLGLVLIFVIPFLAVFPWIFDLLLPTAKELLVPTPLTEDVVLPPLIRTYGYIPILLCLLGTLMLAIRGGRKNYSLTLGLLALLLMLASFYTFHYGVPIMYERGLMYAMLVISIVAGAGLAEIKNLRLPDRLGSRIKAPFITENAGKFLCPALAAIILVIAIPARLNTTYYHMIDDEDYQAFVWIKDNLGEEYDRAILDPWKATAFTAVTGKSVYTRIHTSTTQRDKDAYSFLKKGSSDTAFLEENRISIIYTRVYEENEDSNTEYNSNNPDLVEIARNIYLLNTDDE